MVNKSRQHYINIDNQICVIWVCIEIIQNLFYLTKKKHFFSDGERVNYRIILREIRLQVRWYIEEAAAAIVVGLGDQSLVKQISKF